MLFRTLVSALLVGAISFGNTLQTAVSTGQPPTEWQVYSAIIGGVVLFLNDIKSRITPTAEDKTVVSDTKNA